MRVWVMVALILVVSAYGQFEAVQPPALPTRGDVVLTLELFDEQNNPIQNTHARVQLTSSATDLTTLKYVQNGQLKLSLAPDTWDIHVLIDDIDTPGKDYQYATQIALRNSRLEQLFLLPVGSLQGTVYLNNKAVPNADVLVYCSEEHHTKTDITGAFTIDWLPTGMCKITAASNDRRGESIVQLEQGDLAEVEINLSEGIATSSLWIIAITLTVLIIIVGIALTFRTKPREKPNTRTHDILQTLNERERTIAEYLLSHGGRSTQATLKNETGIPKTTLIRIFDSLTAKNIITVEKIGKMKKITLTDWFNGKTRNGP